MDGREVKGRRRRRIRKHDEDEDEAKEDEENTRKHKREWNDEQDIIQELAWSRTQDQCSRRNRKET